MPLFCDTDRCDNLAAVGVSVLMPTGETIADDTGEAPVLRESQHLRVCDPCSGIVASRTAALGGYADITALDAHDVFESLDGITAYKFALEVREVGGAVVLIER